MQCLRSVSKLDNARMLKLLIVDDDDDLREVFQILLSTCGYEVRSAKTGVAAFVGATEFDPDVIFVDDHLADFTGNDFVKLLRTHPYQSTAYIVAFSGYPEEWRQGDRERAGFDGYLGKPALLDRLSVLLESIPSRRTLAATSNGTLREDAPPGDLANPGPALARLHAERSPKST